MSDDGCDTSDQETKLVRPSADFQSLLILAGATKDLFTMKEVMHYLGQYIMQKQLYDKTEQHMVHCSQDALGQVLGVQSFSVKEPRVLFSLITKKLVAVKSNESSPEGSQQCNGQKEEEAVSPESTRRRRRRSRRSSEPGPSCSVEEEKEEGEEEEEEGRKRRRSDSFSLTFDDSLSWCVIGGLRNDTDCHDHVSDTPSTVSDHFSVEFEVESLDSEDYSDEETSLSGDDQVYEVTIFEAEQDSSDEDPEITKADYWRCSKCDEWNPPLPRNCNRCWELRQDWLPELSVRSNSASPGHKGQPTKTSLAQSAAFQDKCPGAEESEEVDVPDGKRSHSSPSIQPPPTTRPPPSPPPCPPGSRVSMDAALPDSCVEPCVICQSRPKNGCIVHGRTGHLMACYSCAKKLKRRNKLCPVCREPIQSVVLTYLS